MPGVNPAAEGGAIQSLADVHRRSSVFAIGMQEQVVDPVPAVVFRLGYLGPRSSGISAHELTPPVDLLIHPDWFSSNA